MENKRQTGLPANDENLKRLRRHLMLFFEQNIGKNFRIKGANLVDTIQGVDWEYMHVCGKTYGNFHIDLCEYTNQSAT